jgi:alginate O-acetyltransferase complex protein AlgI
LVFTSYTFLIFFPIVVAAYFLLPHRWRWALILVASYYFYAAWKPEYALIILASTSIDYVAAIKMHGAGSNQTARRLYLLASLAGNMGMLFTFKYFNFVNDSIGSLAGLAGAAYPASHLNLLLPVGISFYTFQSVTYTVAVYRGQLEPMRHFGIFAAYVAFFPQLVAGPIERAMHFLPQFLEKHTFQYDRVASGLRLMAWGFFKKVAVADKLGIVVDGVYSHPTDYTGLPLILATYCFAFQIYFDFSAYTDIARGAARIMGFELLENFQQPYLARSIPDFWRRWHITLSSWFRDYLYIPLGGNRAGKTRWYLNILIVFVVSGLWHGASWNFAIWGALHGVYMVVGSLLPQRGEGGPESGDQGLSLWGVASILLTFHLVWFSWIFFRANSLPDAWYIVTHLFTELTPRLTFNLGLGVGTALVTLACAVAIEVVQWAHRTKALTISTSPAWVRWPAYYAVALLIVLLGDFGSDARFIYFQF